MLTKRLIPCLASAWLACSHQAVPASVSLQSYVASTPPTLQTNTCPSLPAAREASSESVIARHGTSLSAYQLEGGVWLGDCMLINEDFDFALAMTMDGIGAGLASQQRKARNASKREALSKHTALGANVRAELDALRSAGFHAFFLLWGSRENAQLKLVVDPLAGCPEPTRTRMPTTSRMLDGPVKPVEGEQGWTSADALDAEASRLIQASLTLPIAED